MKYASEDLINEHQGILFGLKILEKIVLLMNEKNVVEINDLKDIVNFIKLFADKCHHGKEEGILFPAMEEFGIPKDNGPIGQMLLEHTEGRKYVAQMNDGIQNKEFDKNKFAQAATNYISLLRNHINKENNVLFPLGDKKIPLDRQTKILELFEAFEENVMGAGTHEKLHELLHNFEAKYLI